MTRAKKTNPVYAVVTASYDHGYGHINIHVYEIFGFYGTLKITCQSGGMDKNVTYAWKYGLSNDMDVSKTETVHQAYLALRRIDKGMDEFYRAHGEAVNFAEFAMRVLRAAKVPVVSVHEHINRRIYGKVEDLPKFSMRTERDALNALLTSIEAALLNYSKELS